MTELNEKGFPASDAYPDFMETLMLFLPQADVMVLSGSLPPDLNVGLYHELTALANTFGVKVILDCDGDCLKRGIKAKPYAIKPNLAEFQAYTGADLRTVPEIVAAARELNAQGVKLVAVSMGAQGAVFVRDTFAVRTVPFPIEPESAAAAGDTMVAMLAYATVRGMTIVDTARLMTAAGTLTAALPGTQVVSFEQARARAQDVDVQILEL